MEQVDLVRALVEERAAALALPCGAPSAAGVVSFGAEPVGDDPIDAHDFAKFAIVDKLLNFLITRFGAELEHGAENFALGFLVGRHEAFAIGFVHRDRFLDHDVKAMLEAHDTERGVGIMRGADQDGVAGAGLDEFLARFEGFDVFVFVRFGRCGGGDGSEFAARDFPLGEVVRVVTAHISHPDDTDSDGFHG